MSNTKNLNETEVNALVSRFDKLNGKNTSATPYVKAIMDELVFILATMPEEHKNQLIKTRNELVFMRLKLQEVIDEHYKNNLPSSDLTDNEIVERSLTIAGIDGVFGILELLQDTADMRLYEIDGGVLKPQGVLNESLN